MGTIVHIGLLVIGFAELVIFLFLVSMYHSLAFPWQLMVPPVLVACVVNLSGMIILNEKWSPVAFFIATGIAVCAFLVMIVEDHHKKLEHPAKQ